MTRPTRQAAAWVTVVLIAASVPGAGAQEADSNGAVKLRIMSYNILHGTDQSGSDALTSQGLAIKQAAPDLVGLQEVDVKCRRSGSVDQMAVLSRLTGMHKAFAPHIDYQGGLYGLGLLSRYPLSDVRNDRITLYTKEGTTETRALLSAVATLDDKTTVVMATVHMGLDKRTRLKQAEEIVQYLGDRGAPVVLTGDLNAEPGTPEIDRLEKQFINAGAENLADHTYPAGEPVKTIDFILLDKATSWAVQGFHVMSDVTWSDHYPLMTTVTLSVD